MFWYGFFIFLHVTFEGEENQLFDLFLVCFSQLHRFSKDVFEMVLMKPIKLPIDHKKYQEIGSFWVCQKTHLLSYVLQTFFDLLLGQQTIHFGTVDTDLIDM